MSTGSRYLLLVSLMFALSTVQLFCEEPSSDSVYRIAVFTPTTEGNTYWPEVHRVMHAAAVDLNIELEIYEFDVTDRFEKVTRGVERLNTEPLPDAAIFSVAFGQAQPLMDAAEQSDIPFYLHGPLFPSELSEIGYEPRRKYRNWIGYFHEDEETKGYVLATQLISAARQSADTHDTRTIYIAGINGDRSWYGSILREAGLRRAIDEHPDVQLLQMVYTRWTPQEGHTMAVQLLRRYPDISILWAASDQLAIGVAQALNNTYRYPEPTIHTGGLDLSDAGLSAVIQGKLTATVANTQFIWAQVLVDVYDHLRGITTSDDIGSWLSPPPVVATPETAMKIRNRISTYDEIDFRRFSRFYYGDTAPRLSAIMGEI